MIKTSLVEGALSGLQRPTQPPASRLVARRARFRQAGLASLAFGVCALVAPGVVKAGAPERPVDVEVVPRRNEEAGNEGETRATTGDQNRGGRNRAGRRLDLVVQAGLIQPIVLAGGNGEIDLIVNRFVIGYSHGFLLKLRGGTVVGEAKRQGLAFDLPFSTGLSAGYMIRPWLDLRGEFKWHRFDVRYDDSRDIDSGDLFSYDTFTLGAGLYAHWRPWRKRSDWLRGWNTSTSVRFWPSIATTLDNNRREYDNSFTGEREIHQAANIGIANTPFIFNVSVGYAFDLAWKKK